VRPRTKPQERERLKREAPLFPSLFLPPQKTQAEPTLVPPKRLSLKGSRGVPAARSADTAYRNTASYTESSQEAGGCWYPRKHRNLKLALGEEVQCPQ